MALKELKVVISDDNRDKGKIYHLTEMPALKAEKWATRAFLALSNAGAQLPDDVMNAGMEGIAHFGFSSLQQLKFHDVEPLMDEMIQCVQIQPSPNAALVRGLVDGDIEELATLYQLRRAVFGLHVDFSKLVAKRNSEGPAATSQEGSFLTRTSPAPSAS